MKFRDYLIEINACSEAVKWVGKRELKRAWAECQRGDWMLWFAEEVGVDNKVIAITACDCVEPALAYAENDIPQKTLATVQAWARGEATLEEAKKATEAAWAAARAAKAATEAAAWAAAWAAEAAQTAWAATEAAWAAAWATTEDVSLKHSADMVRKNIPYVLIKKHWMERQK